MPTHNNFFTISKALGIILMVVGHSVCPDLISRFIYLFHMPLFFFCSGIFFIVPKSYHKFKQYLHHRMKRLYWPFIKWNIIFLLLHNLFYEYNIYCQEETSLYSNKDFVQRVLSIIISMSNQEPIVFQLWFLKQLLLSSVLICSFSYILYKYRLKDKPYLSLFALISLTIITKSTDLTIPIIEDVSIVLLSTIFFYIGSISNKYICKIRFSISRGGLCFCILIILTFLLNSKIEMLSYNSQDVPTYICAALIGIYMIICFAKYIENSQVASRFYICKMLYYIGNNTMVILIWHLFAFKLGSLIKILLFNYPLSRLPEYALIAENNTYFWIIYTIIGCCLPLIINYLITCLKKSLILKHQNNVPRTNI